MNETSNQSTPASTVSPTDPSYGDAVLKARKEQLARMKGDKDAGTVACPKHEIKDCEAEIAILEKKPLADILKIRKAQKAELKKMANPPSIVMKGVDQMIEEMELEIAREEADADAEAEKQPPVDETPNTLAPVGDKDAN